MSLRYYQKNIINVINNSNNTITLIEGERQVGITFTLKELVKQYGQTNPQKNILYIGVNMSNAMRFIDQNNYDGENSTQSVFTFNNGSKLFLSSPSTYRGRMNGRNFDLIVIENIEHLRIYFEDIYDFCLPSLTMYTGKLVMTYNEPFIDNTLFVNLLRRADLNEITYMYVPQSLINNNNI
jgi:hypothetical protein